MPTRHTAVLAVGFGLAAHMVKKEMQELYGLIEIIFCSRLRSSGLARQRLQGSEARQRFAMVPVLYRVCLRGQEVDQNNSQASAEFKVPKSTN